MANRTITASSTYESIPTLKLEDGEVAYFVTLSDNVDVLDEENNHAIAYGVCSIKFNEQFSKGLGGINGFGSVEFPDDTGVAAWFKNNAKELQRKGVLGTWDEVKKKGSTGISSKIQYCIFVLTNGETYKKNAVPSVAELEALPMNTLMVIRGKQTSKSVATTEWLSDIISQEINPTEQISIYKRTGAGIDTKYSLTTHQRKSKSVSIPEGAEDLNILDTIYDNSNERQAAKLAKFGVWDALAKLGFTFPEEWNVKEEDATGV